jgi:formamidopyrimidine-DNA glycosylase
VFELPELNVIAAQMNDVLPGRVVAAGHLGNAAGSAAEREPAGRRDAPRPAPHKFVWYDRPDAEFAAVTAGLTAGEAWPEGKWLFLRLDPGHVLLLGEWGGRIRYYSAGEPLPDRYQLWLEFTDGSSFIATTQMWGGVHLCEDGREREVKYVKDMRPTPVDEGFDRASFAVLIAAAQLDGRRSVKGLLTQDQLIPGLGNAIAQDILFRARLHPRRGLETLAEAEVDGLYAAITGTVREVIAAGGRYDERDLRGRPGGYVRVMDAKAVGRPCPACGASIEKISYLGGACYLCPVCQPPSGDARPAGGRRARPAT